MNLNEDLKIHNSISNLQQQVFLFLKITNY